MGRHKDPETLSFIQWLKDKGESLGFTTRTEYSLHKGEYYVDLVWKLRDDQEPIITFEIETSDGPRVFANTSKIFGTLSKIVSKPWRHFMVIIKTDLSSGHRNSLFNVISQHNVFLFENVLGNPEKKEQLQKTLEGCAYDISELINRTLRAKPLGESLPSVLKGLAEGLDRGIVKEPEITISIESRAPVKGGIKFTTLFETPKGEPTFLDRLEEAMRTLQPFTIEAPQLKGFRVEGKPIHPANVRKAKLTIIPKPAFKPVRIVVPGTNVGFENVLLRNVKTEGKVDFLSSEDRNLPYIFELALDRSKNSGNYDLALEPSSANVKQAFKFEEFIRALNVKKEIRIIDQKENKTVVRCFVKQGVEQSQSQYDLLSKLSYIQTKTNHIIPVPRKVTQEDYRNVMHVLKTINTGEARGVVKEISISLSKQKAMELISVAKAKGKISDLEASQSSTYGNIFSESIQLGPSKIEFPDMRFALPIEEIEKRMEAVSEEGTMELALKPCENGSIAIRFENWPQES